MRYLKEIALSAVLCAAVPATVYASTTQDMNPNKNSEASPALTLPSGPTYVGKDTYKKCKDWAKKKAAKVRRTVKREEPDLVKDYDVAKRAGKRIWNKYTR